MEKHRWGWVLLDTEFAGDDFLKNILYNGKSKRLPLSAQKYLQRGIIDDSTIKMHRHTFPGLFKQVPSLFSAGMNTTSWKSSGLYPGYFDRRLSQKYVKAVSPTEVFGEAQSPMMVSRGGWGCRPRRYKSSARHHASIPSRYKRGVSSLPSWESSIHSDFLSQSIRGS